MRARLKSWVMACGGSTSAHWPMAPASGEFDVCKLFDVPGWGCTTRAEQGRRSGGTLPPHAARLPSCSTPPCCDCRYEASNGVRSHEARRHDEALRKLFLDRFGEPLPKVVAAACRCYWRHLPWQPMFGVRCSAAIQHQEGMGNLQLTGQLTPQASSPQSGRPVTC